MVWRTKYRWASLGFAFAVPSVVYWFLYWRTLNWGWLVFDDKALVWDNPHLGHYSWSNVWWALTDSSFGRRWTPVLWLLAETVPHKIAWEYHALVLVLGWVLTGLVLCWFLRKLDYYYAILLTCVFVCSPLRNEVFGWIMGFVYLGMACCCVASFLCRKPCGAVVWALLGVLCYPSAAGVLLVVCWLRRHSAWSWFGVASLVAVAVYDYTLRVHIGFIPMHYRWGAWPWTILHYTLSLVFPFVTSPVFPAGYYPALAFGAFLFAMWAGISWRSCVVALVVLSPVLAASVTESFWFGGRYALLFDVCVLYLFGRYASRYGTGYARIGLVVVAVLGAQLTRADTTLANGNLQALERTVLESKALGADCAVYTLVLGHLDRFDLLLIRARPALLPFLPPELRTGAIDKVPYFIDLRRRAELPSRK